MRTDFVVVARGLPAGIQRSISRSPDINTIALAGPDDKQPPDGFFDNALHLRRVHIRPSIRRPF